MYIIVGFVHESIDIFLQTRNGQEIYKLKKKYIKPLKRFNAMYREHAHQILWEARICK